MKRLHKVVSFFYTVIIIKFYSNDVMPFKLTGLCPEFEKTTVE